MSILGLIKKTTVATAAAVSLHAAAAPKPSPVPSLERPLITGASVSADWSTASPGKTLALRYTEKSKIKTIAYGGRPGRELIKDLRPESFKDRSIVMAIDFLFWDSTLPDPDPSIKALDSLLKQASAHSLPVVLGEIPELLPGRQAQRARLNQEIARQCSAYERCFLMPFDELHKQVMKDGYLAIKGKRYRIQELIPDGLHLSVPTSEYLADLMLALLSGKEFRSQGKIQLT